jgi:AraC-like DNA-binding protein
MQVTVLAPSARLAQFVARYIVVEAGEDTTRVLLSERGLFLGVRYAGAATLLENGGATRLANATVTGIHSSARRMLTHAGGGIVLALFEPAGASRFLRVPLHELFGAHVPLDALLPRLEVELLGEQLASQPDHARRVSVLEAFLLAQLSNEETDPVALAAVRAIESSRGALRIASLARELGIRQDPLEKRFRRAVGASPKQLASIVRLHHAIDIAKRSANWAQVAHDAGYFDQSHFIREFRAMTGEPPTRFFRAGDHC